MKVDMLLTKKIKDHFEFNVCVRFELLEPDNWNEVWDGTDSNNFELWLSKLWTCWVLIVIQFKTGLEIALFFKFVF